MQVIVIEKKAFYDTVEHDVGIEHCFFITGLDFILITHVINYSYIT